MSIRVYAHSFYRTYMHQYYQYLIKITTLKLSENIKIEEQFLDILKVIPYFEIVFPYLFVDPLYFYQVSTWPPITKRFSLL